MEPKLLSYEEYCKALTNDPTPNFLHGLPVHVQTFAWRYQVAL